MESIAIPAHALCAAALSRRPVYFQDARLRPDEAAIAGRALGVERRSDAVEWSAAVVEFAWKALNLNRVYALQLGRHPLASRVLADIGMQREGLLRRRVYKGGLFEDIVCWTIARLRRCAPASLIKRTS